MSTEAVRRELGEILSQGEPERAMGQGEAAEQTAEQTGQAFWDWELATEQAEPANQASSDETMRVLQENRQTAAELPRLPPTRNP